MHNNRPVPPIGDDRKVLIECAENVIPPFAESALEQLYGNLFSLPAYYRVFGGADRASTYAVID
ncbi:MAG: hypothetical protein ACREX0_13375, partial [Noviherbaspirillum sp.]